MIMNVNVNIVIGQRNWLTNYWRIYYAAEIKNYIFQ